MQKHTSTYGGHELSRFLIAYLMMILGVLMLVHVLQPEREGPGSSSRSPVHQERQKAAKQSLTTQAGSDRQAVDPGRLGFNRCKGQAPRPSLQRGAGDYPISA